MNVMPNNSELAQRLIKDRGLEVFLYLLESPVTASELSERLGFSRAKVNYILDALLKQEYITLHSEKMNGVVVEKCYASNASTFQLLFGPDNDDREKLSAILYMLDVMKTSMVNNLNKHESFHLGMVHARVHPSRAKEYMDRLQKLQMEFDDENLVSDDPECKGYTMAVSLFQGYTTSMKLYERN